jgi:hypothetical protein
VPHATLDFLSTILPFKTRIFLILFFANYSCVKVTIYNLDLVEPDAFHPPRVIDLSSTIVSSHSQPSRISRDYARADYVLHYMYLSSYDWSCVYNQSSTDSAVDQLKWVVTDDRFKKINSDEHYFYFLHFRKQVKVTIKSDRRRWLKSVDDSLKTHPQHFCK